jgi:hypothetical protein
MEIIFVDERHSGKAFRNFCVKQKNGFMETAFVSPHGGRDTAAIMMAHSVAAPASDAGLAGRAAHGGRLRQGLRGR